MQTAELEPPLDERIAARRQIDTAAHAAVGNFETHDVHTRAQRLRRGSGVDLQPGTVIWT